MRPRTPASRRARSALATLAVDEGRLEDALAMLEESLRLHHDLGDLLDTAVDLCRTARALSRAREPTAAVRILASFEGFREDVGIRGASVAQMNDETLSEARAQLDPEAFAEAWEQGRHLTSDEALSFALAALTPPRPRTIGQR